MWNCLTVTEPPVATYVSFLFSFHPLTNVTSYPSSLEPIESQFVQAAHVPTYQIGEELRDYRLEEYCHLFSTPFPSCLTILLSDLAFDHDLAISASLVITMQLAQAFMTSFALSRFGYRLIARPFF
jgi:hypothetical protein